MKRNPEMLAYPNSGKNAGLKRDVHLRRTKIICMIGPATESEERLEQLMHAGMNVARLNFSHGTHQEHKRVIERVRALSTRLGYAVAILQDLQGPKIRTGTLEDTGGEFNFSKDVLLFSSTEVGRYTPLRRENSLF